MNDRDLWFEALNLDNNASNALYSLLARHMLDADPATMARLLDEAKAVAS